MNDCTQELQQLNCKTLTGSNKHILLAEYDDGTKYLKIPIIINGVAEVYCVAILLDELLSSLKSKGITIE